MRPKLCNKAKACASSHDWPCCNGASNLRQGDQAAATACKMSVLLLLALLSLVTAFSGDQQTSGAACQRAFKPALSPALQALAHAPMPWSGSKRWLRVSTLVFLCNQGAWHSCDMTAPASTDASWSLSPKRTKRACAGTAWSKRAINSKSIIEASSTTITSACKTGAVPWLG